MYVLIFSQSLLNSKEQKKYFKKYKSKSKKVKLYFLGSLNLIETETSKNNMKKLDTK